MSNKRHIVVIGNGIAGVSAARHIRKRDQSCKISIISSETKHFFSRTALMYVFMKQLKFEHTKPYEDSFWSKNSLDLVFAHVNEIDFPQKELILDDGQVIPYDDLILALGSKPRKIGWPGQNLKGVQGLYGCQDMMFLEENIPYVERAVIVGGGLIGIELAEMLMSRNIAVTFLIREKHFWRNVLPAEEAKMISRHILDHQIDLREETELTEIISDDNGRVKAITTSEGEVIDCQFVGLTIGVTPNISWLDNSKLKTNKGIIVNEFLETNIDNVYAIGDCAEFEKHPTGRSNIEQTWYTGRMMGETVARSIAGKRTAYNPGMWFNSAKFFDIEYQTYGIVANELKKNESQFYWEHIDRRIALKIVFDSDSKALIGVNALGIRLRHELMEKWITNGMTVNHMLEHWQDVNFDPEFFDRYTSAILEAFRDQFEIELSPRPKSWKRILNLV